MPQIDVTIYTEGMTDDEAAKAAREAIAFIQDKYGIDQIIEAAISEQYSDDE